MGGLRPLSRPSHFKFLFKFLTCEKWLFFLQVKRKKNIIKIYFCSKNDKKKIYINIIIIIIIIIFIYIFFLSFFEQKYIFIIFFFLLTCKKKSHFSQVKNLNKNLKCEGRLRGRRPPINRYLYFLYLFL